MVRDQFTTFEQFAKCLKYMAKRDIVEVFD
jgi:hypothetical protein